METANVPGAHAVHTCALPIEYVLTGQYKHDPPLKYVPGVEHVFEQYAFQPGFAAVPLVHERHAVDPVAKLLA